MKKFKNTFTDLELETGETVKTTLAYIHLLGLKNNNKKVYDEYNRIMTKGANDELDMMTILYAAYLCACIAGENGNDEMTYEEFLSVLSPDREYNGGVFGMLMNPKKAQASANRS